MEKMNTQEWEEVRVVTDIGSGLNAARAGLKKILSWAKERGRRQVNTWNASSDIAVATEDRLTRFGMEYIKWILEEYGVQLHIVDVLEDKSAEEELVSDMIALVSSFAGKLYGLRSHKRQRLVEKVKEEVEEK